MKKLLRKCAIFLLTGAICLGSAGCGKEKDEDATDDSQSQDQNQEALDEEATIDDAVVEEEFRVAAMIAPNAPSITAKAAIVVEESTGTILYEKNMREKMYPASMTKMLTALIVMDYYSMEELITVGVEINEVPLDSSKAGHIVGESLTIKNLIRGLIIPSGNDTANVATVTVARRVKNDNSLNFQECETIFAELMNQKAEQLGAINSHFSNAHGYHDDNHYSCAYDMALFARTYMENPDLAAIAGEKSYTGDGADGMFATDEGVTTQNYIWRSHNLLLTDNEYNYGKATGIKTGFTDEAGDCLAAAAEKDGETLLSIIFFSEDPARWTDSKSLFEYGFNQYERVELLAAKGVYEEIPLTKQNKLEGATVSAISADAVATYLPVGTSDTLTHSATYLDTYRVDGKEGAFKLKAPIASGDEIGTAT